MSLVPSGLCDPDVIRAPKVQHSANCADGNRHLGRSTPIGDGRYGRMPAELSGLVAGATDDAPRL